MKKTTCLTLCLFLCCYNLGFANSINNSNKKLSEISQQIAQAQKHLQATIAQENALQFQLKRSEETIGSLANKIHIIDNEIIYNNKKLTTLKQQETQQQSKLEQQKKQLSNQMRLAYKTNSENYLKVLFNQQNPFQINRTLTYYQYFAHAHIQAIQQVQETLGELDNTRTALKHSISNLKKVRDNRIKQQHQLASSRRARKQVLQKIHNRVKTQNQKISSLQANKIALEKVLRNLQAQQKSKPYIGGNFANHKGRLSWPTHGRIIHRFGDKMNLSLRYNGVVIAAPENQNVQAIAPGKVIFANWLKGFGLLIIIDHGNGYMTLYAHCNSLYKNIGDTVNSGDSIASVGNSGGMSEVGLTFEIRHNGTPLNPSRWCS